MRFFRRAGPRLQTQRLILRLPEDRDWAAWARLRHESMDFLTQWEPLWPDDHLTQGAFANRVHWSRKAQQQDIAVPFLLTRRDDGAVLGSLTMDYIRRGPAQVATMGYWVGAPYARQGYMHEALNAVIVYAFQMSGLSRLEAACLPGNAASRGLLEKVGFKYEGIAQSYLQINGRWRNHVLYAALRNDRRGKADQT